MVITEKKKKKKLMVIIERYFKDPVDKLISTNSTV